MLVRLPLCPAGTQACSQESAPLVKLPPGPVGPEAATEVLIVADPGICSGACLLAPESILGPPGEAPMSLGYTSQIERALKLRERLLADDSLDAVRIINGDADGIPGLVVDKLGPVLIAQLHEERLKIDPEHARRLVEDVQRRLGTLAVYRKYFVRQRGRVPREIVEAHKDPRPWIGEVVEAELVVLEYGLRYLVRPYDGFAFGLFLDHRDNRRRIGELSAGRRVLNAFAYTCGFSVAAAAGGAAHVASVDSYKRYLEWGKRNLEFNGLDPSPHRFYCSDIFEFYRRAQRQGLRYDLVVLDPPTFSRPKGSGRVFVLAEHLQPLCAGAVDLLDPGGLLFLATNDRGIGRGRLEEAASRAAADRRCTVVQRPSLPIDFAGDPDYSKTIIVRID